MAKVVKKIVKLQIEAMKATPAPPIGTALGPTGVNIADFCKQFNDKTKDKAGEIVPVVISVYDDRSFSFIMRTAPASYYLRTYAKIEKGSSKPGSQRVGIISKEDVRKIAEKKMVDLNARSIDQAMNIIAGTARSMGLEVK
ncbi:MAG: 50S ribosomal protein L11 [Alphaproteobacteria bacterium]|nr:50S ribosomal protein L11 [Alphaproteobacteria bacterium]